VRRRQQLFGIALIAAALSGSSIAAAQNPPQKDVQPPVEQTQPAATPPSSVQPQPAKTPPEPQQTQPAGTPPTGNPAGGAPPAEAPPEATPPPPPPQAPAPTKSEQTTPETKSEPPPKVPKTRVVRPAPPPNTGQASPGQQPGGGGQSGAREPGAREGGRESAARESSGRESGAGTPAGRESGGRESAGRESATGSQGAAGQVGAGQSGAGQSGTSQGAAGQSSAGATSPRRSPASQTATQRAPGDGGAAASAAAARPPAPARAPLPPFTFATVERLAQDRASKAYRNRSTKLPDAIAKLTFEEYRDIRFQRTSSLWYDKALFEVQFFHRGFNFDRRVNISEVSGGVARPVLYNPAMFDFGPRVPKVAFPPDLGFAGFRIHYPLNTPAYKDELMVFLGASYFRVLGRNQGYGLSARGLAIDTGAASGEEFPYFTDFWLVKPDPTARTMTLYALLDSPGITGAYQFDVRPGTTTQVQVTAELYPRRQIATLGIAPLTSMFLYGENSGSHRFDDYRPEVHDSDGLMTERGTGEWQWRPLVNPKELRVNRFMDEHPRGFGLVQRDRDFNHYQDNEARFERRPSYFVEPLGDWGKGGIELVEIPSDEEIHDNVVSFWVPEAPVQPQKPMTFSYLLSAYTGTTQWPPGGKVIATHFARVVNGTSVVPGVRRVIVDFAGGDLDSLGGAQPVQAAASATGGEIDNIAVERLAANGVWRVSMRMKTNGEKPVDLRCYLTLYGEALTETWTYLWAPGAQP
jgi:glucans biosynthesis protein